MKPLILFAAFAFFYLELFSQKGQQDYLHQFSITTENDNYAFTFADGYYTNGLFLHYSRPALWKTNDRLVKVISSWQLGQMMFVSESFYDRSYRSIDRPFSGYLFLQKGYKFFYHKGHVLQTAIEAGATGKASMAQQVQAWYHHATGLPKVSGWVYQLNGEASLGISAKYHYNLLGIARPQRLLELMATADANAGNAFTNASAGVLVKFGNFENPAQSSFYNARTGRGTTGKLKRNAEVLIFFHPRLVHQWYNATVQGPLFHSDKGPIVSDITKNFYMHSWGIHYAEKRWTLDVHFTFKNREALTMREKERFGSISLGYRFGRGMK
jgi:hypothetical protein